MGRAGEEPNSSAPEVATALSKFDEQQHFTTFKMTAHVSKVAALMDRYRTAHTALIDAQVRNFKPFEFRSKLVVTVKFTISSKFPCDRTPHKNNDTSAAIRRCIAASSNIEVVCGAHVGVSIELIVETVTQRFTNCYRVAYRVFTIQIVCIPDYRKRCLSSTSSKIGWGNQVVL